MEFLNPQRSLEQLRRRRQIYERTKGDRQEQTQHLQASITRAEVELGNLVRRIDGDVALKDLYRQLVFEVEISKGSLKHQSTMMR